MSGFSLTFLDASARLRGAAGLPNARRRKGNESFSARDGSYSAGVRLLHDCNATSRARSCCTERLNPVAETVASSNRQPAAISRACQKRPDNLCLGPFLLYQLARAGGTKLQGPTRSQETIWHWAGSL